MCQTFADVQISALALSSIAFPRRIQERLSSEMVLTRQGGYPIFLESDVRQDTVKVQCD